MRSLLKHVLAAALVASPASAQDDPAAITAADLAARIRTLAHDSMQGRYTPSAGLDRAAAYAAREFARVGLEPAGDAGTFIQAYRIAAVIPDTASSLLRLGAGAPIGFGGDAIQVSGGFRPEGVTAPVVVVTGDRAPAGPLPVTGRVVIAVVPTDAAGEPTADGRALLTALTDARPAAVVVPVDVDDAAWAGLVARRLGVRPAPVWRGADEPPHLRVRSRAVEPFLRAEGLDRGLTGDRRGPPVVRSLAARATLVSRGVEREGADAPNVVALLPGADTALRHEVVVVSAHMDHVGTTAAGRCRPVGADSICNGADDNASGTASVLELAEAFAALPSPPRRSLVFLLVSGEERGLWGSAYFAAHPSPPGSELVADLNLDMVGRNWPDTLVAIGREHSDLGATLDRVAAAHPELGMTVVDDPWPNERFFFRSDHYNFARRGVPALFFFTGTHDDYHRPTDESDSIDTEKQARLTRLVFHLALEVANAPDRPRWSPRSYREIVETR